MPAPLLRELKWRSVDADSEFVTGRAFDTTTLRNDRGSIIAVAYSNFSAEYTDKAGLFDIHKLSFRKGSQNKWLNMEEFEAQAVFDHLYVSWQTKLYERLPRPLSWAWGVLSSIHMWLVFLALMCVVITSNVFSMIQYAHDQKWTAVLLLGVLTAINLVCVAQGHRIYLRQKAAR